MTCQQLTNIFRRELQYVCRLSVRAHSDFIPTDRWDAIPKAEVERFIIDCMTKVGTKRRHAVSLARNLMAADYRGHYSHGMNRLDLYVNDIKSGITVSDDEPSVEKQTVSTALVCGNNVLGPVVGNFCMELAIKKAKETGVGWVVANSSNHYGIAGYYAMLASNEGLLGMSFTNTSPLVVPTRAKEAVLGTNPISLAAPGKNGDSFVLDMATSTCALGKVELHDRKNIRIPLGWGVDSLGKMSNEPKRVLNGGGLMPLGGAEETSGYKGYGLAMMVEIFCGILGNAAYGANIRKWKTTDRVANLGQCFIAVDPEAFAPGFSDRLDDLMNTCRQLENADDEEEVLVAGDPERQHMSMCDLRGGIPYHQKQIEFADEIAEKLGVKPMKKYH